MINALKNIIVTNMGHLNPWFWCKTVIDLILFAIVIMVMNKTYNFFFGKIIKRISDTELRKNYQTLRQLGLYIIDTLIILFFGVNLLERFGIDMRPILATAGVFGVAVGFGAKTVIEDILSGLSILLSGQIRVGDFVTVNSSTGTVEKVTLTMIVIRAFNGDVHYIRNGHINTIVNQTKHYSMPVFKFSVAYKTDVAHAINVLKDLGKELREKSELSRFVLSDIEVFGLDAFLDSSITILCRIKTTPQEQWAVRRKFNQMVKERFEREGIEIPFPQMVVYKNDVE